MAELKNKKLADDEKARALAIADLGKDISDTIDFGGDEDWIDVGADATLWKPAFCPKPLVGYLIKSEERDSDDYKKSFRIVHVLTTRPTLALDRDRKVVRVEAGKRVAFIANHALLDIAHFANHPTKCYEVAIKGKEKIDIKEGKQTMWTFDVHFRRQAKSREEVAMPGVLRLDEPEALRHSARQLAERSEEDDSSFNYGANTSK